MRVGGKQYIAIYTFDGLADLQLLQGFTDDTAGLKAAIDSLSTYETVESVDQSQRSGAGLRKLDTRRGRRAKTNCSPGRWSSSRMGPTVPDACQTVRRYPQRQTAGTKCTPSASAGRSMKST